MAILYSKDKRFKLRFYKEGDEHSLQESINEKLISKNTLLIPYPYTLKDAKYWIKHCKEQYSKKEKTEITFAIDVNGKVVGGIGILNIEKNHKAEIGYWLGKKYRGQRIMSEAVKLMTNYSFKTFKLKRIVGRVFTWNCPSRIVLEKNGYVYEGTLKKNIKKGNKLIDEWIFANVKK